MLAETSVAFLDVVEHPSKSRPGQMARGRYRQREYPPHRRTPATVEEQLPGSSFSHFFSKPVAVQVGDQSRMYADTRQKSEASASCYVQVLRSIKQVLHDRTSTKGRTPAARDPLQIG